MLYCSFCWHQLPKSFFYVYHLPIYGRIRPCQHIEPRSLGWWLNMRKSTKKVATILSVIFQHQLRQFQHWGWFSIEFALWLFLFSKTCDVAVAKIDGRFNNIKYAIYNVYGVIHVCLVSKLWFSVILFFIPQTHPHSREMTQWLDSMIACLNLQGRARW